MTEKRNIFVLQGTSNNRHGFNVEIIRNGITEKHKIHIEGGRPVIAEEIDLALVDNGVSKRVKIVEQDLIDQLDKIALAAPSFVKFIERKDKPKKDKD